MPDTPPPAPAPPPRTGTTMIKNVFASGPWLGVLVLGLALVGHLKGCIPTEAPQPPDKPISAPDKPASDPPTPPKPDPPTPPLVQPTPPANLPALVLTAQQYRANFGPNFAAVGDRVASGELTTQDAILEAMRANATPFNQSLAAAIQGACSANGTVNDKDGLAKLFKQVGEATGGK